MFESVVFPAPFSPSSACTSPAAASKSTSSLATTPGKRLVIPRSETAGTGEAPVVPAPLSAVSLRSGEPASANGLARRAADDPLGEPVHRVQILDREAMAGRNDRLALLVEQRAPELVELARDQSRLFRRRRRLRGPGHGRS